MSAEAPVRSSAPAAIVAVEPASRPPLPAVNHHFAASGECGVAASLQRGHGQYVSTGFSAELEGGSRTRARFDMGGDLPSSATAAVLTHRAVVSDDGNVAVTTDLQGVQPWANSVVPRSPEYGGTHRSDRRRPCPLPV
jgi:hypothetical protein